MVMCTVLTVRTMKHLITCCLLLLGWITVQGQSVDELQKQLQSAATQREKLELNYQIAEQLMRTDAETAIEYAKDAHKLAQNLQNNAMLARTAFLTAEGYERERDERNQEVWLKSTLTYAKRAGDSDLIIRSVDERSDLWRKKRNYRRAYEINKEAFEYFSSSGTSISELESQYERQKAQLAREKANLEQERQLLQSEIDRLIEERNQIANERNTLSSEKQQLEAQQDQLVSAKNKVEQEISKKEEALVDLSQQKQRAEEYAREQSEAVKKLSRDTLEKRYMLEEARADLAIEQLKLSQRTSFLRISGIGVASLFLIFLLTYWRFRSKKRSAQELAIKNEIIQQERQRSEDLLLNILPAAIASELKENQKAQARRFEHVSVFFSDFRNFTQISEELSPEELVEELDKCFKAFDHIIGQYEDIEKIKTIGDAYMCASGLTERTTIPYNMVRAALEIQQFLDEYKQVRQRQGKPFFEARIGIHTGPVVAGVVGTKKFAYDIWGDTVNMAARMETNCPPGQVNVSETTFQRIQYRFDCRHRGKIYAKNKGDIDMYFVERERVGAAV